MNDFYDIWFLSRSSTSPGRFWRGYRHHLRHPAHTLGRAASLFSAIFAQIRRERAVEGLPRSH